MIRILKCLRSVLCCFLCLALNPVYAKTYTVDDLVELAKTQDFTIKAHAENLFRAYMNIQIAIGRLLPAININALSAAATKNFMQLGELALGFLFPSNWFQWKENKLLYQAERYSFVSFVASQINAIHVIVYQIHYFETTLAIFTKQIERVDMLLHKKSILENEKVRNSDLLILRNAQIRFESERLQIQSEVKKLKIELANGVGLSTEEWDSFELASITLPDLNREKEIDANDFKEEMIAASPELVALEYLILGSKYALLARSFEFMHPGASMNANLGFGYPSYLRVQRSMTRELKIKQEDIDRKHHVTLETLVVTYNSLIKIFTVNKEALENEQKIEEDLDADTFFDLDKLVDNLEDMLHHRSRVMDAQHKFLLVRDQLNRLLMRAPHYDRLLEMAPKKPKKNPNFILNIENKRILNAVRSGKIKLPNNHTF